MEIYVVGILRNLCKGYKKTQKNADNFARIFLLDAYSLIS